MKKSIVITSIFNPTEAVKAFAQLKEYELIVVGDTQTPEDWYAKNATYLSVQAQTALDFHLISLLPFNHYSRKMIGYLLAIRNKTDYIVDSDDDNIPKQDWSFPILNNTFECLSENLGFINIYQWFTGQKIWPRGLPLNLINIESNDHLLSTQDCKVGIWQGLADEDPDVDAIYRLVYDIPCYFNERTPIVLGKGTICPFNSQNTIFVKELFPLLYLPTSVTFRFTDILRGLVAQPIMWLYHYQLGFTKATVVQKRNPHDYMKDFISELPMYEHSRKIIDIISPVISSHRSMEDNLHLAYHALLNKSIVSDKELKTLDAWLSDLEF